MFDKAIINIEKRYILEANDAHGVYEKLVDNYIETNLPILVSEKGVKASDELLEKISRTITKESVPFNIELLKNVLDKIGDDYALLEIARNKLDDGQEGFVIVIRSENKCGVVMSLISTVKTENFYCPWQSVEKESEE